jgi:hypothetical protein
MKAQFGIGLIAVVLALPFVASADEDRKKWSEVQSFHQAVHGPSVYDKVVDAKKLPTKIKRRGEASIPKLPPEAVRLVREGDALAKKVMRTQGKIDPDTEAAFDKEMSALIMSMDQLLITSISTGGDAAGPAACMMECDSSYPGLGGGNGWNRFWCKSACLKIELGPVGVGGD